MPASELTGVARRAAAGVRIGEVFVIQAYGRSRDGSKGLQKALGIGRVTVHGGERQRLLFGLQTVSCWDYKWRVSG